ncbi:MAG: hypothetical protein WC527_05510 [Candidatus Margulisiibacteriota bacterium]
MTEGLLGWYKDDLIKILFRPIFFFTRMEQGPLKDKPVTFLLISCCIFSFLMSVFVFTATILPMVSVLIVGISGAKLAIIIPLFSFFCFIFFVMIYMIAGSVIMGLVFSFFYLISLLLNYAAGKFGETGDLQSMIKASFYSGAVLIPFSLVPVIAMATRYKALSQQNLEVGLNLLFVVLIFYLWGLWSIAMRKIYGLSKSKALLASFTAVFLVLLLQMTAGSKIIAIIERWTV